MREYIKKSSREYKFILLRVNEIMNSNNRDVVLRLGYSPYLTGLRFKDIDFFHKFYLN